MPTKPRSNRSADESIDYTPLTVRAENIVVLDTGSAHAGFPLLNMAAKSSHRTTAAVGESEEQGWIVRAGLRHDDGRTEEVDLLIPEQGAAGHNLAERSGGPADNLRRTLGLVSSERPSEAADQLVSDWLSILGDAISERRATAGILTESQRTWLLESGAMTENQIASAQDDVRAGALKRKIATTQAKAVLNSLSPQEVAELLGISTSTVSHRRADGTLYGIAFGRSRRYPTWQFVGNRPLPHLASLIGAISPEVHPATIDGFMRTPQPELTIDGRATEPHLWLSNGGAIEPVLQLLDRDNRE